MESFQEFKPFLRQLAETSGKLIAGHFLSSSLRVDLKADRTIVTQADREAEETIRTAIRKNYPEHGIIGEEFGNERQEAEFVWVIDPIDGTISFVSGVPLFGSLIGLLYRGKPVLGCIHQPVLNLLCIGDNTETTCNGVRCHVRAVERLEDAVMLSTDVQNIARHQNEAAFNELRNEVKLFRTWGDCYGYLLVATGRADIMLDPIMNPWDLLPVIPVVRGAGGVITAWNGQEPETANSCIAASPVLHQKVIEKLR